MVKETRLRNDGFSLIEVVIALVLFTFILGAAAQALITHFTALNIQEDRNIAAQHCRAVIGQMRKMRDTPGGTFPGKITTPWPEGWQTTDPTFVSLPNETITVNYESPTANPLVVTVTCRWRNIRGSNAIFQLSTSLTDR